MPKAVVIFAIIMISAVNIFFYGRTVPDTAPMASFINQSPLALPIMFDLAVAAAFSLLFILMYLLEKWDRMFFLLPILLLASCSDSIQEAQTRKNIIDQEKAEEIRRDTSPAYEWDQMEVNTMITVGGDVIPHNYTITFNEEYVDLGNLIMEGHWVSKRKFITNDTSTVIVSPNTVQLSKANRYIIFSNRTQ